MFWIYKNSKYVKKANQFCHYGFGLMLWGGFETACSNNILKDTSDACTVSWLFCLSRQLGRENRIPLWYFPSCYRSFIPLRSLKYRFPWNSSAVEKSLAVFWTADEFQQSGSPLHLHRESLRRQVCLPPRSRNPILNNFQRDPQPMWLVRRSFFAQVFRLPRVPLFYVALLLSTFYILSARSRLPMDSANLITRQCIKHTHMRTSM